MTLTVSDAPFGKSIVLFNYHVCFIVQFVALSSHLSCYSIIKRIVSTIKSIVFFYCQVHFMLLSRLFRCSICCFIVTSIVLLYHQVYCVYHQVNCVLLLSSPFYATVTILCYCQVCCVFPLLSHCVLFLYQVDNIVVLSCDVTRDIFYFRLPEVVSIFLKSYRRA